MNLADLIIKEVKSRHCDWNLLFQSQASGSIAGKASFCMEQGKGSLTIDMDGHHLEAIATSGDFLLGGGFIQLDGERIATFISPYPAECKIQFTGSSHPVYSSQDGWKRRFLWAWKHGLSWKSAWGYASWGERITGRGFILASPLKVMLSRWRNQSGPLLNKSDAEIVATLPVKEQMAVIVILLRKKCGLHPHVIKYKCDPFCPIECPDVPSFDQISMNGMIGISCNPDDIPAPRTFRLVLGGFLATGNPLCKTIIFSCLIGLACSSKPGNMAGFVIVGMLTYLFMLLMNHMDAKDTAPQRIPALGNDNTVKNNNSPFDEKAEPYSLKSKKHCK